jgi:hypothetical protein
VRVVNLSGPVGIGKTWVLGRLAAQVASIASGTPTVLDGVDTRAVPRLPCVPWKDRPTAGS